MQNMMAGFASDDTPIYKQVHHSTSTTPLVPPPSYQIHTHTTAASGGGADGPRYGGLNMNMKMGEPMKSGRGRPRKYGPDGTMALGVSSRLSNSASARVCPSSGGGGFSSPMGSASPMNSPSGSAFTVMKKGRGRPPGSSGKQKLNLQASSLGSSRNEFHAHVVTVKAGEDVSSKIMSYLKDGPRAVCIISANGLISNVTLRRAAMSSETVTYEGRFEILTLSGSFLLTESDGGHRSRTGGLSIALLDVEGRVLGGGVAGILTAASPVQVVMGGFDIDESKKTKKPTSSTTTTINRPPPIPGVTLRGHSSPNLRAALSGPSGGPVSPLDDGNQQEICLEPASSHCFQDLVLVHIPCCNNLLAAHFYFHLLYSFYFGQAFPHPLFMYCHHFYFQFHSLHRQFSLVTEEIEIRRTRKISSILPP